MIEKFEELLDFLHKLKGSASTFGFEDLGNLASKLEESIKHKEEASVKLTLKDHLDSIQKQLESSKKECSSRDNSAK
jgi:HPt (histidine-containing phosphotransfer) domain-containing protein